MDRPISNISNYEEISSLAKDYMNFNIRLGRYIRDKFNINGKNNFEISMRQFQILGSISHLGASTISELEEIFQISKSSLSLTISKMEKAGLLCKEAAPHGEDRRVIYLRLTEEGIKITEKFDGILCKSIFSFYNTLNDCQKQNLKTGFMTLSKVFKEEE